MRILSRLRFISLVSLMSLVVLGCLLVWVLTELNSITADDKLASDVLENVFQASSLRDQYFMYRDERAKTQWHSKNQETGHLISQALMQFTDPADRQALTELQRGWEDSTKIFLRIVANSGALQAGGNKVGIHEDLDKRLRSQLLVKTAVIHDATGALHHSSEQRFYQSIRQMIVGIGICAFLLVLLITSSLSIIVSLVRSRLNALHVGAQTIANGQFEFRIDDSGADELSKVARSINCMARDILDITQKRQAEALLLESERRFRELLSNVRLAVVMLDVNGNITYCNDYLLGLSGWELPEVIGQNWFQRFLPEPQHEKGGEFFRSSIETGVLPPHFENTIISRHGEEYLIAWDNVILRDARNNIVGAASIGVDMTECKCFEGKLVEYGAELIRQKIHLQELIEHLRAMSIELTRVEERERKSITRDLHDGLGQILCVAKLKLSALPVYQHDACGQKDKIKSIEDLIDQANEAVRSLSLQLTPPTLQDLGLLPTLRWLAEELKRNYGLTISIYDENVPDHIDPTVLKSIYFATRELLINVARHAQVNAADLAVRCMNDQMIISVTDNGIGFDKETVSNPSTKGCYGLFSVRERIDIIGGSMEIDSNPGEGTLIVLTVPLVIDHRGTGT